MARKPLFKFWTAEDGALLAELLREGRDYKTIARRLKRSAESVRQHAKRLAEPRSGRPGGNEGGGEGTRLNELGRDNPT
jgi:hypothetical protein